MDTISGSAQRAVFALAGVILVGSAAVLLGGAWDAERIGANILVASYCLLGLGLGGAVFLALLFVTGARWSDLIRPVATQLRVLLPVGAVGVLLVLIAFPSLYPWTG